MQLKTTLSAALALALASAQHSSSSNLTAALTGNKNLTALTTLLSAYPDLTSQLASMHNVTLLAPSNSALEALNSSGALAQAAVVPGYVQDLLTYHALNGTFYAANITETPLFPHTLLNDPKFSNVTGGQVVECRTEGSNVYIFSGLKQNASVVQADVAYDNGVIHIIDSVLTLPMNLSSTALEADLTALVGAIEATNLTSTVDSLEDVTIFAPLNSAFQAIASAAGSLSTTQLAQMLEYHIINGTVAYSSALTNASIPTLQGNNVTITIEKGTVLVNSARVVLADVLVAGGVVHLIDSVLNPNNTALSKASASASSPAVAYAGASSGTVVPFTSGVPTPTSTVEALASTTDAVAAGYATPSASAGQNPAGGSSAAAGSKSSTAGAARAVQTGAVGAAALFGGAALVAAW